MFTGNAISSGSDYYYLEQSIDMLDGRRAYRVRGVGLLTPTPQTAIAVNLYPPFNRELRVDYPVIPLTIPINAEVMSAAIRLPMEQPQGSTFNWGQMLPRGAGILGTSTDVVKLGLSSQTAATAFAAASTASITCSASRYAANSGNRLSRKQATADSATSILNTMGAAANLMIFVSNAANTAAGSGISLTGTTDSSLIAAEVIFCLPDDPLLMEEISNLGRKSLFL